MFLRITLVSILFAFTVLAKKPNILLICVDDLRPELNSLGAKHIHSPAMDSLVESGRAFTRHYVQAPTCGSSRYALLMGKYASRPALRSNGALFSVAEKSGERPFSLPRHFRENGYRTISVGKVSHHPGGMGGEEWNDSAKPEMPGAWNVNVMPTGRWETPRKAMHGYAEGKPRISGKTPPNEHIAGDDMTYTDGLITREALKQMDGMTGKNQPFFLAVGIMKPHLPFACPKSYRDIYDGVELPMIPHPNKPSGLSTWHGSREFFGNYNQDGKDPRKDFKYADEMRRSYAACVSYADAQVGKLLAHLDELNLTDDTIVVLWGDHGWHLGEHSIWGKHSLFEESLLAPMVIRAPGMNEGGVRTEKVVETVDIYPTLCELSGISIPEGLSGESLVGDLNNPNSKGGTAISYFGHNETIRTSEYRLIRHGQKGELRFELYDHSKDGGETVNLAEEMPEVVKELNRMIEQKLK